MLNHVVLFGATGDLAGRFLFPALAELAHANLLPENFEITASSNCRLDEDRFQARTEGCLRQFAKHLPISAHQKVLKSCKYQTSEATLASDIQRVVGEGAVKPALYYLALPPAVVPQTITALAAAGIHRRSRIAIEKPFGRDLRSATKLAELIKRLFGKNADQTVFNVDHVLGRASVQALTDLRLTNPVFEAAWNSDFIEEFNILWEETIALEGRIDFYDATGALKDVMQNHLMQVLSLGAMDLPGGLGKSTLEEDDRRQRKIEILEAVQIPSRKEAVKNSQRGRYTAGALVDDSGVFSKTVMGYLDVDGVIASRATETFAEIILNIATPRWAGTRFRLRTGKACTKLRKGIEIRFRPINESVSGARLWIGLNGPNTVELELNTTGADNRLTKIQLSGPQPTSQMSPYANVLKNCLGQGNELSVNTREAIQAWRIMTPFLEAWDQEEVPLQTYPAGSTLPYLAHR